MKVSLRSLSFSWSEVMRAAAQLDLSSGRGMPPISQKTNSFLISRILYLDNNWVNPSQKQTAMQCKCRNKTDKNSYVNQTLYLALLEV